MKNNKIINILIMALAMISLTSCSKDDSDSIVNTQFTISKSELQFSKTGGDTYLYVQAKEQPTLTSSASWVKVTQQTSESKTVYKFLVSTEKNSEYNDRTATISVAAGSETGVVSISETSTEGLIITSSKVVSVGSDASNFDVKLQANNAYIVTVGSDWLTEVTTRANMKDYTHQFVASKNIGSARSGQISFTLTKGDVSITEAVIVNQDAGTQVSDMNLSAMEVAKLMYPGWNLGNTMEGGDFKNNFTNNGGVSAETSWQSTKTTQKIIDFVKAQGFKSIRIPVSWVMGHIVDADNMTIDEAWVNRVKEIVNYCVADGLYVIINDHWDGGWIEVDGFSASRDSYIAVDEATIVSKSDKLKKLWTNIANAFKDYDEHVVFAGLNEPFQEYNLFNTHHKELTPILERYNQAFVDAVRSTGGNNTSRVLVVQGPSTNISSTCSYLTMPTDSKPERLMVEVHYYDPWNFTSGQVDTWNDAASVKAQFESMKTNFVDKKIPVIVGECGANWQKDNTTFNATLKSWYKTVFQYAGDCGLVPFAWDINSCSIPNMSIINRSSISLWNTPAMGGISEGVSSAKWPN
ncbi:cellulase family glycosylhydrolase [Prevotella sp.]|uniref:cellulase family glycosylhydrolase n=1 Tax=Prevotella sp. TaxID=59823 RepID=UPI003DA62586